jgi:hypothetical protein
LPLALLEKARQIKVLAMVLPMLRIGFGLALAAALGAAVVAPAAAQPLPPGSYQESCRNSFLYGGILTANCKASNGAWVWSQIDPRRCSADLANINGKLTCVNARSAGYRPGGRIQWPPAGSYTQTCRDNWMRNDVLTATCSASNGAWVTSSLDITRCRPGSDIPNVNGRLECLQYK